MTRPSHIKGDSQVGVSTRTKLSSCTCSPPLFEAVHNREERIFYVEPLTPLKKTKQNKTQPVAMQPTFSFQDRDECLLQGESSCSFPLRIADILNENYPRK